ncbi:MAG: hypothetical protein H7X84_01785 [Verrucomicrobia bacterium]|nr:hypothetical protein [Prolixibacteraceae bacterium]
MKKVAHIVSIIGHPLLTYPIFLIIVLFRNEVASRALGILALIIGCVFIPVIIRLYLKSKNGTYTNFDVSDRNQRKSIFWFSIPLLMLVTAVLFLTNQSINLCISVLFALILLIISSLMNFYTKSSLHVSFNIYLSALIVAHSFIIGSMVLLFTVFIGWSRLKLGRHTFKEVLFGSVLGVLMSFWMLTVKGYL